MNTNKRTSVNIEDDISFIEDKENIDSDDSCTPPKNAKKSMRHRMQKFRNVWLTREDFKLWLTKIPEDPYKAKCKLCNMKFTAELTVIKNHLKAQNHQRRSIRASQSKIENFLHNPDTDLSVKTKEASKRFEIKLCAFIAEHNISLRVLDHLTPLIKNSVTDSDIVKNMHLKTTKGIAIMKNVLGSTEKKRLQTKLKHSLFSILIDECTDISAVKAMCIVVRFFDDEEGRVVSRFWDICQIFDENTNIQEASADHLFNFVITSFNNYQVSFNNVIGFASDGCNTMMGNYNSVASRFRTECPGIYIFKCICHSLHLCASEACKVLPRACEDLARNVYNEFKNSAKRIHQFQEFQTFLDIKTHKILRPSQTRWLSLSAVVERMIEQWEALHLYFLKQRSTARLLAVEQIIQALENPLIKLFYLFLQWILPKFNNLNLLFQSESVVLTTLYDKMKVAYQELLEIYLNKHYVCRNKLNDIDPCSKEHRLHPDNVYLGVRVMEYLNQPEFNKNNKLKNDFRLLCIEFVMVACSQIKKRFDFDNQILQYLSCLNPSKAMLRSSRDQMPSLLPLMKALPRIANSQQYQQIDDEWRQLPYFELPAHINAKIDQVDIFWSKLLICDEGDQGLTFKTLSKFILNVISLPHSNADCERIFSKVNLIKTKTRNKLVTPTMNAILLSKQRVQDCVNFEPSKDEYNCMTSSNLYSKNASTEWNIDDIIMPNE